MTAPAPAPCGFADRLLAEAVRALEHDRPLDEPDAVEKARVAGGDFERRLVTRARALRVAEPLEHALHQAGQVVYVILAVGVLLAAAAGAGAARASLATEADATVNFFWALGGLLGIQTLLLVAWLAVMIRSPRALAAASLGGVVLGLGRRLAARWHRTANGAAAVEAIGTVYARGPIARWTLGSISHGLWVVFNAACLVMLVLMLSARQYRFVWETTILTADTYVTLTRGIAWLPARLGFAAPTAMQIEASDGSRAADFSEATRHAWSGLLVGSLVTYGMAPRLILFGFCMIRRGAARRRYRLDTSRPVYLRLRPLLLPATEALGVVDPDTPAAPAEGGPPPSRDTRPGGGAPVILGVEIARPASTWPPRLSGLAWHDLGFVDDRQDRQRVLGELEGTEPAPSMVVAVCALTTTPDRGIGVFLEQARGAAGAPLALVLTGGQAMRARGASIEARVEDWRALSDRIGVAAEHVVELDLDHLTDASAGKLAELVGVNHEAAPARRLESAFELIVEHLDGWPEGPPDAKRQAKLHEAIGGLYRRDVRSWTDRLRLPAPPRLAEDLPGALREGADRVLGLLPRRLRLDPRWIASGAVAGALGCVTAAALAAPAVIGALPIWTTLGAAIAASVKAALPARDAGEAPAEHGDARSEAVRAATLFALLLELQGRDETRITRLLDEAVGDDDPGDLGTTAAARRWLDGVRHRLDLALAAEGGA